VPLDAAPSIVRFRRHAPRHRQFVARAARRSRDSVYNLAGGIGGSMGIDLALPRH
jgi:hypothetical protein